MPAPKHSDIPAEPVAPLVAQRSGEITFVARRSDLRLVLRARLAELNPTTGQKIGWKQQGIYVAFNNGVFRVPPADDNGQVLLKSPAARDRDRRRALGSIAS
jgi:hypothetical protein